jgi:hypothetical protein
MNKYSKNWKIKTYHSFKRFGFKIIFSSILLIGCVYQTYYICRLYYSYPTIVSTETQFVNYDREFPAITFCVSFNKMKKGLTLNESLNLIKAKTFISGVFIFKSTETLLNVTEGVQNSIVTVINSRYYCQTINYELKGMTL